MFASLPLGLQVLLVVLGMCGAAMVLICGVTAYNLFVK